ncbi:hypothetical protein LCGC14_0305920 [marine sediment metagenome]|uniref:Uncharacterized protein n=1 Tax=marine sediment metagenome TaxID=412755 RepID=A0A0F9WV54_9ZZZZ
MKFREEKFDTIKIKTGSEEDVTKAIEEISVTHIIIDMQYGFTVDRDSVMWYSVLIIARKK